MVIKAFLEAGLQLSFGKRLQCGTNSAINFSENTGDKVRESIIVSLSHLGSCLVSRDIALAEVRQNTTIIFVQISTTVENFKRHFAISDLFKFYFLCLNCISSLSSFSTLDFLSYRGCLLKCLFHI